MVDGLRNLLDVCRKGQVRRFVHLSSVMVYGDPPSPDSATEDAPTAPKRGTYGWIKLKQDRLVGAAAKQGLPSVTLCPPNISGAGSPYLMSLVVALRMGEFALMERGEAPCNVVDVHNLCHAIELALDRGPTDGQRLFITDDYEIAWRDLIDALLRLVGEEIEISSISRHDLLRLSAERPRSALSLRQSLLHLISSDVRAALRKDPLWARVDVALRKAVSLLGTDMENRLRLATERQPIPRPAVTPARSLNLLLCAQQLRSVRHECTRAKHLLGYRPMYSFESSMRSFRRWYSTLHGWNTPMASLLKMGAD